jgi:hypothetical protein
MFFAGHEGPDGWVPCMFPEEAFAGFYLGKIEIIGPAVSGRMNEATGT